MSFLHPAIEVRIAEDKRKGLGLFATARIQKGELISDTEGDMQVVSKAEEKRLSHWKSELCYEISEREVLCPINFDAPSPTLRLNHSCKPNVVSNTDIYKTYALRDIKPGAELATDYATIDADPNWKMECFCGEPSCRKFITGNDWKSPEIQARYRGHFQKNVQDRIDQERAGKKQSERMSKGMALRPATTIG